MDHKRDKIYIRSYLNLVLFQLEATTTQKVNQLVSPRAPAIAQIGTSSLVMDMQQFFFYKDVITGVFR